MQEDKDLKILLKNNAIMETTSSFNIDVMRRIKNAALLKQPASLLNKPVINILIIAFVVTVLSVIICLIYFPLNILSTNISFNMSNGTYRQLFSFIIVFWIVMLINTLWNKLQTLHSVMFN